MKSEGNGDGEFESIAVGVMMIRSHTRSFGPNATRVQPELSILTRE